MHLGPHSIRTWRDHRGLTLEQVAESVRDLGEPITPASISRVERRKQPYSQSMLEKMARALNVPVSDLVAAEPPSAEERELLDVLRSLDPEKQQQAIRIIKALKN